jgi:hypothetical protein
VYKRVKLDFGSSSSPSFNDNAKAGPEKVKRRAPIPKWRKAESDDADDADEEDVGVDVDEPITFTFQVEA